MSTKNLFHTLSYPMLLSLIFLGLATSTFPVPRAEAHVLAIDNSVGAVLHIDPNDDPSANELATFTIEFKNVNVPSCDCNITIQKGGMTVLSKKSTDPDVHTTADSLSFVYTFPTEDTYILTIQSTSSSPFKVSYNIDIDSTAATTSSSTTPVTPTANSLSQFLGGHAIHIILFGGAILISIYIIITDKGDGTKTKTTSHTTEDPNTNH